METATHASSTGPPPFAAVFREHAPYVWRVLRRLGVREADTEDMCQEVFVVVHRKLPEFEGRSSLQTWIYGICVRVASDHRRRAHVRREQPTDAVPEERRSAPQLHELEREQARAMLDQALALLDDDKRAVFVLYEIEELEMKLVAEAVGCPLQTAYSRLHAARKKVAEAIERRIGGGEA
jgi:RNA polymerase sigma-70 factor, ECF subfamily